MENISHAQSAAGFLGWKASALLLLLAIFFPPIFSLQALKFSAFSSVEISL